MTALDTLRLLVLLEGGVALGMAGFVIRLYLHANRIAHNLDRPVPGALPYHVFVIASSHALLIVAQILTVATHLGEHFIVYGVPFAIVAFTLSIIGLVDMLRFQNLRINRLLELAKPPLQERG